MREQIYFFFGKNVQSGPTNRNTGKTFRYNSAPGRPTRRADGSAGVPAPQRNAKGLLMMIGFAMQNGESPVELFGKKGPDDLVGKCHAGER